MRRAGESGQATVEWIGLLLGLALAFGGALGVARGAEFGGSGEGLGEELASRLTCAARDACRAEGEARRRLGRLSPSGWPPPNAATPPTGAAPGTGVPPPTGPIAFGGLGIRPSAPWEAHPRGLRGLETASSDVLRALGRAGKRAAKRAWIVCLGYRRVRYELEHPSVPGQGVPPGELLDALNECLNPWQFLFG